MKASRGILGLLLILSLFTSSVSIGAWAAPQSPSSSSAPELSQVPADPSTGCHAHTGQTIPHLPYSQMPARTGYQCCLTGHNTAAVQTPQSSPLSLQSVSTFERIEPAPIGLWVAISKNQHILSGDPSDITLRI